MDKSAQPKINITTGNAVSCANIIGPFLIISPGYARFDNVMVKVANSDRPIISGLMVLTPSK